MKRKFIRWIAQSLFKLLYRVELRGLENYPRDDGRYVLVSNHISLLDGPLLMSYIPDLPIFAINSEVNEKWWARIFTRHFEMYPLNSDQPMAVKGLIKMLRTGRRVVIFPEGRITSTGTIMKVYEGATKIAQLGDAKIIPLRIDGPQYTRFGRLQGKVKQRLFPKITLTFCPPVSVENTDNTIDKEGNGKRDKLAKRMQMYDLMTHSMYVSTNIDKTLSEAMQDAITLYGHKQVVIEDMQREAMTLGRLHVGSIVLSDAFDSLRIKPGNIGVLLPNISATVVTFYALQRLGWVAAMLNYTAGVSNVCSAIKSAGVETIITSKKFIEVAELEDLLSKIKKNCRIVFLEDIKAQVGLKEKISALAKSKLPTHYARKFSGHNEESTIPRTANDIAVILFTSGSSGTPKAVALSHKNLLANSAQVKSCIDFTCQDIFFNALPLFHSFGLGVGMVLPVTSGIKTFLYPSPLHFKAIPEFIYDTRASVLFGTDTFLQGYARHADADHFQTLRYVIAGAEKLKASTRQTWLNQFGQRILEGYGVTETSPAISLNNISYCKDGSVGRLLPGIEYQLRAVEGISEGAQLWVKGENIMLGYIQGGDNENIQRPHQGWYDTGDIVSMDACGFITIIGRAKRFAKVAGEMISLARVELWIEELWSDYEHCVCTVTSERKGERLILVTNHLHADKAAMREYIINAGGTEIMLPSDILTIDEMPKLGSGKCDYVSVDKIANNHFSSTS